MLGNTNFSPEDINKIPIILIQAIKSAREHIQDCDKAFQLIEDTIDALKDNVNDYYNIFMETGDTAMIFDKFVNDLPEDFDIDATTMGQFKRIILFFRSKYNDTSDNVIQICDILDNIIMQLEDDNDTNQ